MQQRPPTQSGSLVNQPLPMVEVHTVLVVGATGSVGMHVVAEAVRRGFDVRALVRRRPHPGALDPAASTVVGDLTDGATLAAAVDGIDAVVFTHGSAYGDEHGAETVDFGAVLNVLDALDGRRVRIALMTAIGVTVRGAAHDWKRRSERLVRASGNDYTIVRPGWFDYNADDQLEITMLQGDTRRAGGPSDGVIARAQIARVLLDSLSLESARRRTFELVAQRGPAQVDLDPVFAGLDPDPAGSVDGVRDPQNMPLAEESARVRADLEARREH